MKRKKLLLVYNPVSGKGSIVRNLHGIISLFSASGYDVTAYPTACVGDGERFIAENAQSYDVVCSCGGDGMLHELFNGIREQDRNKPCGYIPAGTMNDFASSLGLPKEMMQAADVVTRENFRYIDAGVFCGERFAYVAAFGAFTEISYNTDTQLKNMLGAFAYFIEGLRTFELYYFDNMSERLTITYGDTVIEDDFVFGMAGNTLSVAGLTRLVPSGAAMDDGLLDCMFIRSPRSLQDLERIRAALVDESLPTEHILRFRTESIVVESASPVHWDLDGEYGGAVTRAEISVQPRAVRIAVPTEMTAIEFDPVNNI